MRFNEYYWSEKLIIKLLKYPIHKKLLQKMEIIEEYENKEALSIFSFYVSLLKTN